MLKIPADQIGSYRQAIRSGSDRDTIVDVGYFLIWYSAVDVGFTQLFALASGIHDYWKFDTLCSGMDLRVKMERFRKIRKRNGGIGPNLDKRLRYLDDKCRPIRNRLAHCAIIRAEDGTERYFATTLGALPYKALGEEKSDPRMPEPIEYSAEQLLGWGAWLALFAKDLSAAMRHATATGEFEIPSPLSNYTIKQS